MKATKYTNKELVEVYKNLKTSAKILGFSSANDSEMIAEIELEAIKRHLNLVDGTVEETAEIETAKPETAETDDSGFEYYSVETAYEVDFRDRQNEVFKTYSEAEKTAGDNIILEVDLIVRNDKKAVSEHDKEVFEDETDEIECRCIWYHHNGVKGMIAQDTKRVIKKPETAEVSKEVVDNRKEVNSTSFIQQLYDAEYSKTLTVQGGIERFLKLAKEFVKNKSTEMSLIVDTAAQVLHDKYKLDYGTIETLEIEAYNS